jgi:glycosyltransferase involved in cell wall biosynthesis
MKIYILIAAYNESGKIGQLVSQIQKLDGVSKIIVIDDGSVDSTREEAEKAGAFVIKHEKNKGKGAALRTGFAYVKGQDCDAVITLDGDGQHKYSEIFHFIEAYKKGDADIVVGSRMLARHNNSGGMQCKGMPFIRYATNHFTSLVTSVLGRCKVTDSQSGFRLISTDVLKKIELSTSNFEIESEVIIKAARKGFKIKEIPISTVYLADSTKRSKINPFVDTWRFFRFVFKNLS